MGRREITLKTDLSELDALIDQVEEFAQSHSANSSILDRMVVAVSEAATNAMEHGNQLDPQKKVKVFLIARNGMIEIYVEDEGAGFKVAEVDDPLKPENLLKPGGRGLFLMEELADEVSYENNGCMVRLVFQV